MFGDSWHTFEPFDQWQLENPCATPLPFHDEQTGDRLKYMQPAAWQHPGAGGGKCLVFHDSFGHVMFTQWLAEHFDELKAVPSNQLDAQMIEREQPNVVILEMAERTMQGVIARRISDRNKNQ